MEPIAYAAMQRRCASGSCACGMGKLSISDANAGDAVWPRTPARLGYPCVTCTILFGGRRATPRPCAGVEACASRESLSHNLRCTRSSDAVPSYGVLKHDPSQPASLRSVLTSDRAYLVGAHRPTVGGETASGDAGDRGQPQYDSTHVYLKAADFDAFVNSVLATLGGKASARIPPP
jgi:hypothetical protein